MFEKQLHVIVWRNFLLVIFLKNIFPDYLPVLSGFWYWQLFSGAEFCRTCSFLWLCDGLRSLPCPVRCISVPTGLGVALWWQLVKNSQVFNLMLLLCLCLWISPFSFWSSGNVCKEQIAMNLLFRTVISLASICTVAQCILFKYGVALKFWQSNQIFFQEFAVFFLAVQFIDGTECTLRCAAEMSLPGH